MYECGWRKTLRAMRNRWVKRRAQRIILDGFWMGWDATVTIDDSIWLTAIGK